MSMYENAGALLGWRVLRFTPAQQWTAAAITAIADGARWRIEAAWHDRTDTPHGFALILSENADGTYDLQYTLTKDTRRWAYVRDLLPTDGKEDAR